MQTFLPFPDFNKSAQVLDRMRLGKQRVETLQILQALRNETRWKNHPAVKMWKGYERALIQYGLSICTEWIYRGYRDTCHAKISSFIERDTTQYILPPWLGSEEFHRAHRSNLLRKNYEYYSKFFSENIDLPYIWPDEVLIKNDKMI